MDCAWATCLVLGWRGDPATKRPVLLKVPHCLLFFAPRRIRPLPLALFLQAGSTDRRTRTEQIETASITHHPTVDSLSRLSQSHSFPICCSARHPHRVPSTRSLRPLRPRAWSRPSTSLLGSPERPLCPHRRRSWSLSVPTCSSSLVAASS